jgi:purine-nucleoside phosphorylase
VTTELQHVDGAAAFLRERLGAERTAALKVGLVLGSGLKDFANQLDAAITVPFGEVPGWPEPRTAGHGGAAVAGTVGGAGVVCLTGRVHLYEGWTPAEVVRAVRTLRRLDVETFLLTNAAGGIADDLSAGDLMLLTDHLNLTGSSPLTGLHEPAFGERFPDQSQVWSPSLR